MHDNEDNNSIGDCSIIVHNDDRDHRRTFPKKNNNLQTDKQKQQTHQNALQKLMNDRLCDLLSGIYCLVLSMAGAVITVWDMSNSINDIDHLFDIITTVIGVAFLAFVHIDVQRHKHFVMSWEKKKRNNKNKKNLHNEINNGSMLPDIDLDMISVTTAVIFNRIWTGNNNNKIDEDDVDEDDEATKKRLNSYKFLTGKHSGNFYLKIGMIRKYHK